MMDQATTICVNELLKRVTKLEDKVHERVCANEDTLNGIRERLDALEQEKRGGDNFAEPLATTRELIERIGRLSAELSQIQVEADTVYKLVRNNYICASEEATLKGLSRILTEYVVLLSEVTLKGH